jgi:hypothetical protein
MITGTNVVVLEEDVSQAFNRACQPARFAKRRFHSSAILSQCSNTSIAIASTK